jgi:hypothetical protein
MPQNRQEHDWAVGVEGQWSEAVLHAPICGAIPARVAAGDSSIDTQLHCHAVVLGS